MNKSDNNANVSFETFAPSSAPDGQLDLAAFFERGFVDDESLRVARGVSAESALDPAAPGDYAQRLAAARASALAELEANQEAAAADALARFASVAEEDAWWAHVASVRGLPALFENVDFNGEIKAAGDEVATEGGA